MKIISHRKSLMPFALSRTGKISSYPPHQHDFFELTYIHSGEGVHVLNGTSAPFHAHDVLFVPPTFEHSFSPSGVHDQTSIALYPEFFTFHSLPFAPLILDELLRSRRLSFTLLPDQVNDFERIIDSVFREYMFKEPHYERIIALDCARLLTMIERSFSLRHTNISKFKDLPPPLYAALMRIESEYHLLGDSYEVATDSEVSAKHLIRLFSQHLMFTPLQYLNRVRIEKCCELLVVKDITVTDAAYRTGFNDLANFNRLFKRFTGMTPSVFRSQMLLRRIDPSSINRFGFPLRFQNK